MNPLIDPGKVRGLQRVTSADGFFLICALDHLSDFAELLAPDPATVTFADVVTAKDAVVRALAPSISAVLLDPLYALGHLVASGAVPGSVGLMSSIEDEDYRHLEGPRRTRLRENWSATRIKMAGADMCKLLWFYRLDGDRVVAEQQRKLVTDLAAECAELSLPLVVEPIWYPLPGEDPTTAEWKAHRVRGIIASAAAANKLGVDMLKVEFPGYVDTPEGRAQAAAACAELDGMVSVPWVILSAGVEYADFKTQVEIACQAGAAGYLAGRSIWRDAVSTHDAEARDQAIRAARARLEELNAVTRRYGRSYTPARPLDEVVKELPAEWYRTWHADLGAHA
ncbi:tagatose 1,6-diphosphate aldolase [Nonomuraea sp. NPDC049141]|uniref:tagatose 1,6-diphosphate aldolase n=1 Tax=Nonomuraea sp. NPDC049141 TaxID=3155500 RepID=UPI0033F04F10